VKVKPGNPGKSRITLGLTFDDGGYENESVDANVVYPNNPPDKFYMIEPWMPPITVCREPYIWI
jgi:hypothetical protein